MALSCCVQSTVEDIDLESVGCGLSKCRNIYLVNLLDLDVKSEDYEDRVLCCRRVAVSWGHSQVQSQVETGPVFLKNHSELTLLKQSKIIDVHEVHRE